MSFITDIAPHAQRLAKETGILASLIIAQAIHESNWGQSGLAVKGKNLFGIKGTFNGESVTMRTAEYDKVGNKYYIDAMFRKYPSWYESMKDLVNLYKNGVSWDRNKYQKVVTEKDYKKACQAVQTSGYATDPKYATGLINMIQKNFLTIYDTQTKGIEDKISAPTWNGSPLKKGQIGRITILKKINLWKRDDDKLIEKRILLPTEVYRVYGYDEKHDGQYHVGGGFWITKMDGNIKYETPAKALLEKAKDYYLLL